jgi:hypothetical protein
VHEPVSAVDAGPGLWMLEKVCGCWGRGRGCRDLVVGASPTPLHTYSCRFRMLTTTCGSCSQLPARVFWLADSALFSAYL